MKNKMTYLSIGLLLALPIKGYPNNNYLPEIGKDTIEPNENLFVVNEIVAEFPGGEKELERFIQSNIQYPQVAQQQKISGKVIASIEISSDGNVENVIIIQNLGGGCDEEVIRLLQSMPQWKPAIQAGHPIKTKRIFSFQFQA